MVWGEVNPAMFIVLLSQVQAFALHGVGCIHTGAWFGRRVGGRAMGQVGSKDQDITHIKRNLGPLVSILPFETDVAFAAIHIHIMRSSDNFQAPVLGCGRVNGKVGSDVLDVTHMGVCTRIKMSPEAIAVGLFVVDLVFEKDYFLEF